jgi:hypothetical protein
MKYMIMGLEPRGELDLIGADEQNRRIRRHQQALEELLRARVIGGRAGLIFASVGLGPFHGGEPDTITVRNRGGRHLRVDGPFPETKEVLGGFDIIDFDSRQEATDFAKAQHVHESHVAEIRPIREFWWISRPQGLAAPKVFMLTSVEDERAAMSLPESERKQIRRQHQAVSAEYVAKHGMLDQEAGLWVGARLYPSADARTIRWIGGNRLISDGPFAETKEVVGGFNLVACTSIDEAMGWAEKLAARDGDVMEVRVADGSTWIYHA